MLLALAWLGWVVAGPLAAADSPRVAPQGTRVAGDSPAIAPQLVRAVRTAYSITIDGTLSDPLWQTAERVTGFLQRDPNEGTAPSESTVVYVAYDDAALYIAARMYDAHPDSIIGRLGRRDAVTNSDRLTVFIDPYHDRRSGYYFAVDAAGTLSDGTLYNDDWDDNTWDGVWEGKAARDSLGRTAEFRIPYSQLRFIQRSQYVWGSISGGRSDARTSETTWSTPRKTAAASCPGSWTSWGSSGSPRRRGSRSCRTRPPGRSSRRTAGDPFADGSRLAPGIGGDARIGLGPNLTLNATVNPDFGQVEVDPAVVNLSDVERACT